MVSLPTRERGLKFYIFMYVKLKRDMSLPTRERGLKYFWHIV